MVTRGQFVERSRLSLMGAMGKLGLYSSGLVRQLNQSIAPGCCNGSPAHHLDVPILIE
jgi:hypothetical protein